MMSGMPTVLRKDGFDFMIYVDDHEPPHVHVFRERGELVVLLGDDQTRPVVRDRHGFSRGDEKRALRIIDEYQDFLRRMWEKLHGET